MQHSEAKGTDHNCICHNKSNLIVSFSNSKFLHGMKQNVCAVLVGRYICSVDNPTKNTTSTAKRVNVQMIACSKSVSVLDDIRYLPPVNQTVHFTPQFRSFVMKIMDRPTDRPTEIYSNAPNEPTTLSSR
jgi:hypothetical protein